MKARTVRKRFDTRPLTRRPSGSGWRAFRAEAIAGGHGEVSTANRWWRRWEYPILIGMFAVAIVGFPAVMIPFEGATAFTVSVSLWWSASFALCGACVAGWMRRSFWGPRVRYRYRLAQFARVNGLSYQPEAGHRRLAASVPNGERRCHIDRTCDPGRFVVGNYEEVDDTGPGETHGTETGYIMFTLREPCPYSLIARRSQWHLPRKLEGVEPVDGPVGARLWCTKPDYPLVRGILDSGVVEHALDISRFAQIEIIGNELFILHTGGFLLMASPRLWEKIGQIADALAPFVAPPAIDTAEEQAHSRAAIGQ